MREKNVLLARDDIGRPKPSVYSLPNQAHAYGVANKIEEYGVGKLTSSWHLPPITDSKKAKDQKDFRKMNVMGVDAKITQPRQVREFRSGLDVKVKQPRGSRPSNRSSSIDIFSTQ